MWIPYLLGDMCTEVVVVIRCLRTRTTRNEMTINRRSFRVTNSENAIFFDSSNRSQSESVLFSIHSFCLGLRKISSSLNAPGAAHTPMRMFANTRMPRIHQRAPAILPRVSLKFAPLGFCWKARRDEPGRQGTLQHSADS